VTLAFIMVAVLAGVFAYALWQPLKRMQNTSGRITEVGNDLLGHSFLLKHPVSPIHMTTHRFSGVDWKVKAMTDIAAGTMVQVVKVEVGELTVAAK
jgi:membrane protein implicated in regulation of membrane protease activity